jgi:hypothetical protein
LIDKTQHSSVVDVQSCRGPNCDTDHYLESIRENIKASATESLGYYELIQHKPWFDEESSKLYNQRKQAKLQWLQNPSQTNRDNLNNVRHETSRNFGNKRREYVKKNE